MAGELGKISPGKDSITSTQGSGRQGVKGSQLSNTKASVRGGSRAVINWEDEVKLLSLGINIVNWVALLMTKNDPEDVTSRKVRLNILY